MVTISGTFNYPCEVIVLDSSHNKIVSEGFTPGGDTYTKLLLHMNEELVKDSSVHRRPVTKYGSISRSNTASKFGNYSWYFDGADDAVSVPNSSDFDFGSGDYTVECWVNFSSLPTNSQSRSIFSYRNGTGSINSTNDIFMELWNGSGNNYWRIVVGTAAGGVQMNVGVLDNAITTGTWYHIAFVRHDNWHHIYKNGILLTVQYNSISYPTITDYLMVGFNRDVGQLGATRMHGYIDEFRISKGIARWFTNSTPPSSVYTLDSNTKLLLHGEESPLTDEAGKTLIMNGGIARSATQKKFGSYSMYFDGSDDYITFTSQNSQDFQFGSGDFTIDFWMHPTSYNKGDTVSLSLNTDTYAAIRIHHDAVWLRPQLLMSTTGTSWDINATSTDSVIPINSWSHIAVTRKNTTVCMFVNGALYWSGSLTGSLMFTGNNVIGSILYTGQPFYYTGYLDEIRISNGIARWTSNFTPPSKPYKTQVPQISNEYKYGVENITTNSGTIISITDNGELKGYYGVSYIKETKDATGGNIIYYDNYKTYSFTSDGTFYMPINGTVDILLVGGGGAAGGSVYGYACQAAGGGGRVLEYLNYNLAAGNYTVTIGQGATSVGATNPPENNTATAGGTTYFNAMSAAGGGPAYGVGRGGNSASGNSGGYPGGGQNYYGCGGGGDSQAIIGMNSDGGNGTASSIRTGISTYYGGGGSGAHGHYCNLYGIVGLGGGISNFGGGASATDGRGGHGLVVIRLIIS